MRWATVWGRRPSWLVEARRDAQRRLYRLRAEPPVLLEHTHVDPGSYLRWELESVETGCVLRLSHFVTDTDAAIDKCSVVGLHASLSRLVPCLSGQPVAWDWDAFAEAQAHYASLGLAPAVSAP